jgi:hypothetical protein
MLNISISSARHEVIEWRVGELRPRSASHTGARLLGRNAHLNESCHPISTHSDEHALGVVRVRASPAPRAEPSAVSPEGDGSNSEQH